MSPEDLDIPETTLKLPLELRKELKEKLGPVIDGQLPERYNDRDIIAVGDVVTDKIIDSGVIPKLSIVDEKTRRGDYKKGDRPQEKIIYIKNPPELITKESWRAIGYGIKFEGPVLIKVIGEEDLLSLVSIMRSEDGTLVIYGIPDEGMVINEVDEELKNKTREVINKMHKIKED